MDTIQTKAPDYARIKDSKEVMKLPGESGWPLLGVLPKMMHQDSLDKFLHNHIARYGQPSRIMLGPRKGILVTHPDHIQQVLLDNSQDFSSMMGYEPSLGTFYGSSLIAQDFGDHRQSRRIFQHAFKNSALKNYVTTMNPTIKKNLDSWLLEERFNFAPACKKMLIDIAARVFFGVEDLEPTKVAKLAQAFHKINDIGLMGMLRWDLPGLKYHTGLQGKFEMAAFIRECIANERAALDRGETRNNLTAILCAERDENGQPFSDDVIVPQLNLLLFAAHDTTAGALSHILFYLAQPEYHDLQQSLREGSLTLTKDFPEYEDLSGFRDMENAVNEALRLHPAVGVMMRRTVRGVEMGEHAIPAHTPVMIMLHWAHRSEQYWSNPERFDPDRFSDSRSEHKRHQFCFSPFGGGAHKCIGMHVAMLNAKLVLHQILRRFSFSLHEDYDKRCDVFPLPYPSKGLPMVLSKIA